MSLLTCMSDNSRVRVSIVGVVIVALFASLFARLWFLQMGPEQRLGRVVSTLAHARDPDRVAARRDPRPQRQGPRAGRRRVGGDRRPRPLRDDASTGCSASSSEVLGINEKTLRANYDSDRQSPLMPAVVALDVPLAAAARDPRAPRGLSGRQRRRADRPLVPVRRPRLATARLRRRGRRS